MRDSAAAQPHLALLRCIAFGLTAFGTCLCAPVESLIAKTHDSRQALET
jgi:hypothetical protein